MAEIEAKQRTTIDAKDMFITTKYVDNKRRQIDNCLARSTGCNNKAWIVPLHNFNAAKTKIMYSSMYSFCIVEPGRMRT